MQEEIDMFQEIPKLSLITRLKERMNDWWKRIDGPAWLAQEKEAAYEISRELAILFFVEAPVFLMVGMFLISTGLFWYTLYFNYKNWFMFSPEIRISGYGFWFLGVTIVFLIFKLFLWLPKHSNLDTWLKQAVVVCLGAGLIWYFIYLSYQGWLSQFSDPQIPDRTMNIFILGSLAVLWFIRYAPGNTHICKYLRSLGLDDFERHYLNWAVYGLIFWPLTLMVIGKTVHLGFLILNVVHYYQPTWAETTNYHWENNQEFIPSMIFALPYIGTVLALYLYLKLRRRLRKHPSQ